MNDFKRQTHLEDRLKRTEGVVLKHSPSGPERYVVTICGSLVPLVDIASYGASPTCTDCKAH